MGFFSGKKNESALVWNQLNHLDMLNEINTMSENQAVLILKHSTRCAISSMAKNRLELYWDNAVPILPYYLDLLKYREISNALAINYNVMHQSPQILLLKNGVCIYHASHNEIDFNKIKTLV